jgi:hypothetical protein
MVGKRDSFDSVYDGWRCALFIIWFLAILGQTIAQCFADKREKSVEKHFGDNSRSPELESSYLNKLFLWWFNYVPVIGSKKDLTIDDLFELNKENKSEFLTTLWSHYWNPKMERYFEKKRKLLLDGTSTDLLNKKANGAG